MLVVQQIAELVEVQIVEQVVQERVEIAAEDIVELIGDLVVELFVEQTAVMAVAGSVAKPIVVAEELMAEFETAVAASVSEKPAGVALASDVVDKAADAVGMVTVDVVELLAAGAAVVLMVTASDYLQEEKVKLDLLSY